MTEPQDVTRLTDGVLFIRVSSPAPGNPLDAEALLAATRELDRVASGDLDAAVVLLHGAGSNFCAGGDVRSFAAADDRPAFIRSVADAFHAFLRALTAADVPVVAAVRGWAAGAGMSIACHADIVVGGPGTRFRPAYPGIGLSPDGGMTWMLPRIIGRGRAHLVILTDAVITASDAASWGLVGSLVDADDDVLSTAETIASSLATGPRPALRAARRLLSASPDATLHDQLDAEAESISRLAGTPTGVEGVDAFVEKRRPDFSR
ncbi:enoyl-CoA hydratase-related protein [Williamsia deligens]|uniref:Enoyl-CoA hydratase-related protein n=1 Tax=Williamsia deligens TaxID=321325 RepID=A0ABW3G1H1_9NOCA|nr:enoyl-CoA hydratase-related protein [Williamsia deligens]MCP2195087.1 2-(1,2-epoxy-1,2-dihydrophenyl)acetyl-CoA isomerase [Williamsia deligens]